MYSRTAKFLALSSWILMSFIEDISCNCTKIATQPGCADGWEEITNPYVCYKLFKDTPMTWEESADYCSKIDPPASALFFLFTPQQQKHLDNWVRTTLKGIGGRTFWVGMKYGYKGLSGLRSINGWRDRTQTEYWHRNGRRPSNIKKCVLFYNGLYTYSDCKQKQNFMCVREHQIYRRETKLTMKYHAPERGPHIMYQQRDVSFTCSAFLPIDYNIGIYFFISRSVKQSTNWELQRTKFGLCSNRSFTTLTLPNGKGYPGRVDNATFMQVQCYIYCFYPDAKKLCGKFPFDFCRQEKFSTVFITPPIEKVKLSVEHITSTTLQLNCTVNIGQTGKLTWILLIGSSPYHFNNNDSRIIDKSMINSPRSRRIEYSTLLLDFNKERGIDITCFDHDVIHYHMNTTCGENPISEMYCKRFIIAGEIKPKINILRRYLLPSLGLLALVILLLMAWAISTQRMGELDAGVEDRVKPEQKPLAIADSTTSIDTQSTKSTALCSSLMSTSTGRTSLASSVDPEVTVREKVRAGSAGQASQTSSVQRRVTVREKVRAGSAGQASRTSNVQQTAAAREKVRNEVTEHESFQPLEPLGDRKSFQKLSSDSSSNTSTKQNRKTKKGDKTKFGYLARNAY